MTSACDEFITRLFQPAPWVADAACRNHPTAWWYPERGGSPDMQKAKNICFTCPVQRECADAGENEPYGIWGGVAGRTRQRTRNNPDRTPPPIPHGEPAGYLAETRWGLPHCQPCKDAESARNKQRKQQRKAAA